MKKTVVIIGEKNPTIKDAIEKYSALSFRTRK